MDSLMLICIRRIAGYVTSYREEKRAAYAEFTEQLQDW